MFLRRDKLKNWCYWCNNSYKLGYVASLNRQYLTHWDLEQAALLDGNENNIWINLQNWETVFERHRSVDFFFFFFHLQTFLHACNTSRGESFYCLHYIFNAHSHFLSSSFGSHLNVALKLCCPGCKQSNLAKGKLKVKTKKQFQPALST